MSTPMPGKTQPKSENKYMPLPAQNQQKYENTSLPAKLKSIEEEVFIQTYLCASTR